VSKTPILAIGELEMITVEDREAIRRAYYLNRKSKRQIAREQGHSRKTIDKAVENLPPQPYRLTKQKAAPVFGPFQARADALLAENPTRCATRLTGGQALDFWNQLVRKSVYFCGGIPV